MVGDRELLRKYGDDFVGSPDPEFERLRLKGFYQYIPGHGWFWTDHAKKYLRTFRERRAPYGPGSAEAR